MNDQIVDVEMLLSETRNRFSPLGLNDPAIEPILKGGSDRNYFRIRFSDGSTRILVKYGSKREENRHYVEIAIFLRNEGINVPRIDFHEPSKGLLWMEDLGSSDLLSHREALWPARRELYRGALKQVALLHSISADRVREAKPGLQPCFDGDLYRWEQDYFFEHCAGSLLGMEPQLILRLRSEPFFALVANELAAIEPRVLVHRDFQSQNLMVSDGRLFLIDFQGLRYGLPGYDVASLLYDPYVQMTPEEREQLLQDYAFKFFGGVMPSGFKNQFRKCAIQRLMQALGAYGFLGLVRGKKEFLRHAPVALESLAGLLEMENFPGHWIDELRHRALMLNGAIPIDSAHD